ncbi:MAG: LysR family transcriptional regulator [Oligoflexia bacterium]|nr:LysR family transcriptional regulator [Oligoflexia bacterium]
MDYRYLKAFMAVANTLSFSQAAKNLKISQSAVSRQIKLLEESLGHEIFFRTSNHVILTEKGTELLSIVSLIDNKIDEIFFLKKTLRLKIGILHGVLENWFLAIILKYINSLEQYEILITVNDPIYLKQKIINGSLDIVISNQNIQSELVSSVKLFNENLVLINKTTVFKNIDQKKLEEHPWVVYELDEDYLFHYSKKISNKIIQVSSMTALVKLVKEGAGIAIIPDHILSKDDSSILSVQALEKKIKRDNRDGRVGAGYGIGSGVGGGDHQKQDGELSNAIFLTTANYKKYPEHISKVVNLAKKNF